ncbi:MAG: hypothetical protein EBZ77_07370 [Chitinophagia bacterium]|nr:hypothetical protein [Chitinophagia bacterium]
MNDQLKRVANIAGTVLLIIGVFSKHLHYPGANLELVISVALVAVLTCTDAIIKKEKFNILLSFIIAIMFAGGLFKAFHLGGSEYVAGFGVGAAIVIALLLSFRKEDTANKQQTSLSQQNGLAVFLLLIFVVTLMANNPISQMLDQGKETDNAVPATEQVK